MRTRDLKTLLSPLSSTVTVLAVSVLSVSVPGQAPKLVRDINTNALVNQSGSPARMRSGSPLVYFAATKIRGDRLPTGPEPFVTLGFSGTTRLLREIRADTLGSQPRNFSPLGNQMLFQAASKTQVGLWRSDGTTAGTVLVRAVAFSRPALFRGRYYFIHRNDLWVTDGSTAGTVLVKTFTGVPGLRDLVVAGTTLYLVADDGTSGAELWKSDGTAGGTTLVVDLAPGKASSQLSLLVPFGNGLFFVNRTQLGAEPWATDGTATGTQMLRDIQPGAASSMFAVRSFPRRFITMSARQLGSRLLFTADGPAAGIELWQTDGTPAGTRLLLDIVPGRGESEPRFRGAFSGTLYFSAQATGGRELWKTDGTVTGTTLVKDIEPGPAGSDPGGLTQTSGGLFFAAATRLHGRELWRTDGTPGGTVLVANIRPGTGGSAPQHLVAGLGGVLFAADDGRVGIELWRSDGTANGTTLVEDILKPLPNATRSASIHHLTAAHDVTYLAAASRNKFQLWKSDGTAAGTIRLGTARFGGTATPQSTVVDNRLFFSADDGQTGTELWVSDGTVGGTRITRDASPGDSFPRHIFDTGTGVAFFTATSPGIGRELWRSDGTLAGTFLLKDIFPGTARPGQANASDPRAFARLGDRVLFAATNGNGRELWHSDGTATGTVLLKDIEPGRFNGRPRSSSPFLLTRFRDLVLFVTLENNAVQSLWKTDGTAAGTVQLSTVRVRDMTVAGNTLFFTDTNQLWKTDGTAVGTVLVSSPGGGRFANIASLSGVGDSVYFVANPPRGGNLRVLFTSDGTNAGTKVVLDRQGRSVVPFRLTAGPSLVPVGRRVFFTVGNLSDGRELWVSDGSSAGTRQVADLWPGVPGSNPSFLTHSRGRLLFGADDGLLGTELWSLDLGANSQSVGDGCAAGRSWPRLVATDPALGSMLSLTLRSERATTRGVLTIGIPVTGPVLFIAGCPLVVDYGLPHFLLPITTGTSGMVRVQLPVPNNTGLIGLNLAAQGALGPSMRIPFGLDLSSGAYLQVGR